MSRVGKVPVAIADGVKVVINGSSVQVSGKLGALSRQFSTDVHLVQEGNVIKVAMADPNATNTTMWGLSRTLLNNMIQGVSKGFEEKLEMVGVGYKAASDGKYLTLSLGYSHDVKFEIPEGITVKVSKPTAFSVCGHDKQQVGQVAALLITQRPPEPYKGKGINYEGRKILRKEGKKK